MLPIFICEDNTFQRQMIQKIIENEIRLKKFSMEVVLSTGDPFEVLGFLVRTPKVNGLYFLDMELENLMNGVDLARKIKEKDQFGKIIFVTGKSDLADLIHLHKIETMDYIIKDNIVEMVHRIKECLDLANHQINSKEEIKGSTLRIKGEEGSLKIAVDDVIYFEYMGNRVIRMYTRRGKADFEGSLKKMESENINFFQCNSSFVINVKRVKNINGRTCEVEMENGDFVPVAIEKLKMLANRVEG